MNQTEAKAMGIERGYNIASWIEWPEIGTTIAPFELSGFSGKIEDEDDIREVFECMAYDAEENARQFSPFEFTAHAFNECGERSEGLWNAFDDGIRIGIERNYRERETSNRIKNAADSADA